MISFLRKHSTPILFFLLLTLLILAWIFPAIGLRLGILFLLFALVTASFAIVGKHRELYRQGKISRWVFIRNAALEILGVLLAMSLAGWLGRQVAALATQGIGDGLIRMIAGLLVGLLAGIGIGFLVRQTWGRLVRIAK
jgi:hypothetical protein